MFATMIVVGVGTGVELVAAMVEVVVAEQLHHSFKKKHSLVALPIAELQSELHQDLLQIANS